MEDVEYDEEEEGFDQNDYNNKKKKVPNTLTAYGNERTMNLNSLVLTNIQNSIYFKYNLYDINTYHGVLEEISKKVKHLEPWEKGSRKTAGQTGMCGGVRGVGAGGVVSSAYCLLYKLFTLKLTRNQVFGMLNYHNTYVRGLGFLFIRYTQHPQKFWDWFEPYLDDDEEIDPKAGGGRPMTIGNMCMMLMTRLDWFTTLFPRIPVVMMKELEGHMTQRNQELGIGGGEEYDQQGPPNRREGSYNREGSSNRYSSPGEGAGRGRARVDQVRSSERGPYNNNNSREGSYRDTPPNKEAGREGSRDVKEREGSHSKRSPPGSSQEDKEAKTEEEAPRIIKRYKPEKKKKKKKKGSGSEESGEEGETKDEGKIKDLSIDDEKKEERSKSKDTKEKSVERSKDKHAKSKRSPRSRERSKDKVPVRREKRAQRSRSRDKRRSRSKDRSKDRRRSRSRDRNGDKHKSREKKRSRSRDRNGSKSKETKRSVSPRERKRSASPRERKRSVSRERKRDRERRSRSKEKSRRSVTPEKKRVVGREKTPEKRMIKRYNQ